MCGCFNFGEDKMNSFVARTVVALAALYTLGSCVGPSTQVNGRVSDSDLELTVDQTHLIERPDSSAITDGLRIIYSPSETTGSRLVTGEYDQMSGEMATVGPIRSLMKTTTEYLRFGSDSPLHGLVEITTHLPGGEYKRELVHVSDPDVKDLFQ